MRYLKEMPQETQVKLQCPYTHHHTRSCVVRIAQSQCHVYCSLELWQIAVHK